MDNICSYRPRKPFSETQKKVGRLRAHLSCFQALASNRSNLMAEEQKRLLDEGIYIDLRLVQNV